MTSTTLRAVTHRLTTTPVQQLPQIASFLATSLSDCGELLSAPLNQKSGKSESDNAVQVHKLKTRLSSLLQDRTFEGRWTAVVLVKATVEAGQWEVLRGCEPLVRNLISILAKPDPASTKKMCIITLTRIFHLTYQYPTLVREITTPSMPGFITSALNLVSVKPSSEPTRKLKPNTPFLGTVLHAFVELIARHPTIFRPFSAQLHSLLQAIIASKKSASIPEPVVDLAEQVFIALHNCAPKNTSGEEWRNASRLVLSSIHRTSDYVFRAVVEQWESVDVNLRHATTPQNYSQEVGDDGPDPLGLAGWHGIHSGVDRLITLLRLLSGFLSNPTASTVTIPVGHILDLTSRLTSVIAPSDGGNAQNNLQIGREERDSLWAELPRIHTACMELLLDLINALETSMIPVAQTILEQTLWVFRAEKFSKDIRSSTYDVIRALFSLIGPSMTKQNVSSLTDVFRSCCSDILPPAGDQAPAEASSDSKGKSKGNQATVNADSFLNTGSKQNRQIKQSASFPGLKRAASELLPATLTLLPIEYLSPSVRAEIDRTIILTADKNAMFASVLNPVPAMKGRGVGSSIMPFLARSYASEMEVEGLIRPRMPVLMNVPNMNGYVNMEEEEEEEEEEEVAQPTHHSTSGSTGFLKPSAPVVLNNPVRETDSVKEQTQTLPLNKRTYAEETNTNVSTISPITKKDDVQTKKARFEKDTPIAPSQPSLERASPASFTGTAAIPVEQSSAAVSPAPVPFQAASQPTPSASHAVAEEEEESGDEMPTLNMDSDTDDSDEEDVTMDD
ncbi:hypothetical protein ASPWEDRAFT_102064 [Aspergillus wentii DTO 134E9]|uniref:Pre-rRNA-processing protein RIX1 n=1 Tax=Aspergillus wentii DTO 134E9 TaxID=1073089 RepID=A0A1L9S2M1_ASPWE|nr:uncharacterized protein ASPWEDRAFT_102064 [Aspergillus wentii DTO 134E9]KAI9924448.1 hypothetical protein MW887_007075 [Aspergillus wentii]OJJ41405.1 hypothetical protein ASPWEDRAFT_102064 [Aspergillus wentii DTO 134E9]